VAPVVDNSGPVDESLYEVPAKNKKLGKWLVKWPIIGLFLTITAYTVATFVINSLVAPVSHSGFTPADAGPYATGLGQVDVRVTIANIVRTILSLIAILCVLGTIFGLPIGIILMCKRKLKDGVPYDERSGRGSGSTVPEGLGGWNWGAAGLGFIWGISHNVWISLLSVVPYVNFVWWIVMGLKGNEWAWKKNKWRNEKDFKHFQDKWAPWGIAFFVFSIILPIAAGFMRSRY